ncbi:MAG: Wadjet anti-phage system protein JetD domain-containing protein [Bacteroidota bacterium]
MIGPKEVKEKALKWWPEFLRAYLRRENIFPRDVPRIGKTGGRKELADFDRIREEQAALLPGDGKRYTLHWKEVDSRTLGRNRFIDRISVDSREQFLQLTDKGLEFGDFAGAVRMIKGEIPQLKNWLVEHPLEILRYSESWPWLLRVVNYFLVNHEAGRYYIREIPVYLPTKFIETHKQILGSLLDAVLPPAAIDEDHRGVKGFERRYGLKYRQPLVRLRLLDAAITQEYFSGVDDLSLPLDQFAALDLPLRRVIILENKTNFSNLMNFLTLPDLRATAGIFGSGFRAGNLRVATWLQEVELLYWGDLDAHGLQIVNQLRGYFPHLQTFLMDRATLDLLPEYHTETMPSNVMELPNLSQEELALYDYLNDARIRLEQERVPLALVKGALAGFYST